MVPIAWLAAALLQTATPPGPVTAIDGATLEIGGQRVRLWGVAAPARGRTCRFDDLTYDCGDQAAYTLTQLVNENREVRCEDKGRADEAVLARCEVRWTECYGVSCTDYWRDLAEELMKEGAGVQDRGRTDGRYDAAETTAREQRAGVWHDPQGGGIADVSAR
jgi:succinoglycan biosynthesis protein ExoI